MIVVLSGCRKIMSISGSNLSRSGSNISRFVVLVLAEKDKLFGNFVFSNAPLNQNHYNIREQV